MDIINRTRYSAKLAATIDNDDTNLASMIVKTSFRVEHNQLIPLDEQKWPIGQPVKTEFGEFDEDSPYRKQGVDIMLLGKVYTNPQISENRARFELIVGDFSYDIDVYGDRRWIRSGDKLIASQAESFESMPLTWEFAYGGKCPVESGEMPYHANPKGRGFYLSEETAEDNYLPNLEDPDNHIAEWQDQPTPKGVAPLSRESSLRLMNAIEYDEEATPPKLTRIKPSYYNNANPDLIFEATVKPGVQISAVGVRPNGGELSFRLPKGSFHVYVQLDDRSYVFPCHLDSIALLTEDEEVLLGFRCCFRYKINPLERRIAVLYGGDAPDSIPDKYVIDWETFDESEVQDD